MFGDSDFKVIHNPIDVQRFAYNETVRNIVRAELGVQDKIVIGHVGRFSYSKNHEFLLQIFQQITKIEDRAVLVLVGQGELETEIHHQAKELGIEDLSLIHIFVPKYGICISVHTNFCDLFWREL